MHIYEGFEKLYLTIAYLNAVVIKMLLLCRNFKDSNKNFV